MSFFSHPWLRRGFSLGASAGVLLCAGCEKAQITAYQAPKEIVPAATAMPGMNANAQFAPVPRAPLTWQKPAGWSEAPGDEMRVASFSVTGEKGARADVTIIPLPVQGEGDLQNVNRWRNQLGLAPLAEADLPKNMGAVEIDGAPGKFFDVGQTPAKVDGKRILVAQQRRGEVDWYVKMTGEDALVQSQRATFLQFAQSLKFGAPAEAAGLPTGWYTVAPGPMQTAKYQTPSAAEITVAVFPGEVGGLLANVNRWRKQLGLAQISEAELPQCTRPWPTLPGATMASLVNGDQALRAIIVPRASETAFYKMTGMPTAVEAERVRFEQFVEASK